MNLKEFSKASLERCESSNGFNHKLDSWSSSDWITAILGELGEAANFVKKLNRIRDNIPGNKEHESKEYLHEELKKELADVFIYLDLLAQSLKIDLSEIVVEKFNETSKKIGYGKAF